MKVLVIGASQGSGALAVKEALARGHEVTAFARSPEKLQLQHPKLRLQKGDFHSKTSVAEAVQGQEAVIVTASATSLKGFRENPNYFSVGTKHVVEAMHIYKVKKLVILSALGTGESRRLLPWVAQKLMVDWLLKLPFADHARQEQLVRTSSLDWVIVRPGRLTHGPASGRYVKQPELKRVSASISRADVADFLVEAATTERWHRQAVQLGS